MFLLFSGCKAYSPGGEAILFIKPKQLFISDDLQEPVTASNKKNKGYMEGIVNKSKQKLHNRTQDLHRNYRRKLQDVLLRD